MKKTARAHTNIALIKYWGKKDPKLRLPLMSSLSMTLDKFYTDTSIEAAEENSFYLNNEKQTSNASKRVFSYLEMLKKNMTLPITSLFLQLIMFQPLLDLLLLVLHLLHLQAHFVLIIILMLTKKNFHA